MTFLKNSCIVNYITNKTTKKESPMNNIKIQMIAIISSIAIVSGTVFLAVSSLKMPAAVPSQSLVITKEEAVSLANQKLAAEQVKSVLVESGFKWDGKIEVGTPIKL